MGNGQWAMGNGQWAMGNGQWGMGNGQWAMGNGQWVMGVECKGGGQLVWVAQVDLSPNLNRRSYL